MTVPVFQIALMVNTLIKITQFVLLVQVNVLNAVMLLHALHALLQNFSLMANVLMHAQPFTLIIMEPVNPALKIVRPAMAAKIPIVLHAKLISIYSKIAVLLHAQMASIP